MRMSSFEMTYTFHETMGLPAYRMPRTPSVSERILRAKMLLEETIETIEQGLGLKVCLDDGVQTVGLENFGVLDIEHREGVKYDPIETLDGLADVKVIANGTAAAFGLPMEAADREVFESNMSKLDDNGKPIVNKCRLWIDDENEDSDDTQAYCRAQLAGATECNDTDHLIDSTQPKGKILKGPNFRKPNIKGLIINAGLRE